MKHILFVCTGNSCRSVMAEYLFKHMTQNRAAQVSCSSAGISAMDGFPSTDATIRAMREEGIDVSDHTSRQLTSEIIEAADEIYVMEKIHKDWILSLAPEAAKKVHFLAEYAAPGSLREIGIPDPVRMSDSFYKNVLDSIRDCVKNLVEDL